VPDALHERTFASVNSVVRRLKPQPEFILFPGDEVIGLTPDQDILARTLAVVLHHMLGDKTNFIPHKKKPMAV
jgi:hypothetical protein